MAIAKRTAFARGVRGLKFLNGAGMAAASLMSVSLALSCGGFAAEKSKAAPQVKVTDIAGRWSGPQYGFGDVRAKCDNGPCTLTVDVSACPEGWCGVLVKSDGGCGAVAMKVEIETGKNAAKDKSYLHFNGRLDPDPKAAGYVVQATLWQDDTAHAFHLDFIGDTGKELMFYRRSFPFQAHLARTGDTRCTLEKATS